MTQSRKDDMPVVVNSGFSSLKDDERPMTDEELRDLQEQYPTRTIIRVKD